METFPTVLQALIQLSWRKKCFRRKLRKLESEIKSNSFHSVKVDGRDKFYSRTVFRVRAARKQSRVRSQQWHAQAHCDPRRLIHLISLWVCNWKFYFQYQFVSVLLAAIQTCLAFNVPYQEGSLLRACQLVQVLPALSQREDKGKSSCNIYRFLLSYVHRLFILKSCNFGNR